MIALSVSQVCEADQAVTACPPAAPDDADYAAGKQLYWQGCSDSYCANSVQMRGWFDAAAEDDRGRDAYLQAMCQAEQVDWCGVFDVLDVRYNAYGDIVAS